MPDAVHIALLRGINVGGRNRLPMAALAGFFEEAGCGAVRTYIQSGNVVFRAADRVAAAVPDVVASAIERELGFRPALVMRTGEALDDVVRNNPFLAAGAEEKELHVAFLDGVPEAERVAALDPERSPPDAFAVRGREVYLRYPRGMGRTKLGGDYLERTLGVAATVRNWRTTMKLRELAREAAGA